MTAVLILFPHSVSDKLAWMDFVEEVGLALPPPGHVTYVREREGETPWPAVEPWVNAVLWCLSWRLDDTVRSLLRAAGRDPELASAIDAAHRLGGHQAVYAYVLAHPITDVVLS